MRRPLVLGHRGASAVAPENTLAAFRRALADGADGLELDVRLSADGVPTVFHDDDLQRLTGAAGTVETSTHAELAALRVRGEPIPTLAQCVALVAETRGGAGAFAPASLNVELKPVASPVAARALVAAAARLLDPLAAPNEATAPLVVSSFDPRVLFAALAQDRPWRLALLVEHPAALRALPLLEAEAARSACRLGSPAPQPIDLHVDDALMPLDPWPAAPAGCASARALRVWTVDDPARARALAAMTDPAPVAAVVTNDPAAVLAGLR